MVFKTESRATALLVISWLLLMEMWHGPVLAAVISIRGHQVRLESGGIKKQGTKSIFAVIRRLLLQEPDGDDYSAGDHCLKKS
eukprot:4230361-Amphidinium_carterae.1